MDNEKVFFQWGQELDAEAKRFGYAGSLINNTGAESWFGYFNDGYSPSDAFSEDWSYG